MFVLPGTSQVRVTVLLGRGLLGHSPPGYITGGPNKGLTSIMSMRTRRETLKNVYSLKKCVLTLAHGCNLLHATTQHLCKTKIHLCFYRPYALVSYMVLVLSRRQSQSPHLPAKSIQIRLSPVTLPFIHLPHHSVSLMHSGAMQPEPLLDL